ncbi:MAG TPA: hypothetical protein VGD79_11545 [Thermoanaerobaculia bacterium]
MNTTVDDFVDAHTRQQIDESVNRTVASYEHESTLVAETPNTRFQRVLRIYAGIKPLIVFLTKVPLVPLAWRKGLTLLNQALESLATIGADVTVQFKAGKDLEPEA